jgi:hypothetical protein
VQIVMGDTGRRIVTALTGVPLGAHEDENETPTTT